jgi:serine/threonine protein kinase
MQYPLISEYVKAITDAENNLDQLSSLKPVMDDHNEPFRSGGAFAVVFKMIDENTGKYYALKCFTEEQIERAESYNMITEELKDVNSPYVIHVRYLENELFVDSSCTDETEFPVLLMDWVEGETMESYVAQYYTDEYKMKKLYHQFCMMASWLTTQPFAHGDIKPDNLIVKPDGYLTLVDYDGMYVPAMRGKSSPTLGTRDFTHPLRNVSDFDKSIDDFAVASIALSLKAISIDSSLLDEYGAPDRLLFSYNDYINPSASSVFKALCNYLYDEELCQLYGNFMIALSSKSMRFTRDNDEEYIGERNEEGERTGFGILKKIDGSIYAGEWKLNMRSGLGIETGFEMYAGQWRSNVHNGIGTALLNNGIIYSGQWKNGKRHGFGTIYIPNGTCYFTMFVNDKPCDGPAIWTLKDKALIYGNISEYGPTGICIHLLPDGRTNKEQWIKGKLLNNKDK